MNGKQMREKKVALLFIKLNACTSVCLWESEQCKQAHSLMLSHTLIKFSLPLKVLPHTSLFLLFFFFLINSMKFSQ
jgi:hypothetical protein